MFKFPGSVCKFLFATFLVFLCFNGQQMVYANNLVLDKDHLNAIVEVPKVKPPQTTVAPSSATVFKDTNPSTVTHSFDLKFDVGKASDYEKEKTFKLAIGSACNLNIIISKAGDNKIFTINKISVNELKSLTITNEKIIANSEAQKDTFCDPTKPKSGSIKFENPADDPSKFTVELTISGNDIKDLPNVFKLTSSAQIYVPPTSSPNGNNGDESKNSTTISNGELYAGIFTAAIIAIMFITLAVAPCVIIGTWLRDRKDEKNKDKTENKKGIKKKKRTITAEASED